MSISRRFFLKAGTLTAVGASVALNGRMLAFAQTSTQGTSQNYQIPLSAQQDATYMFNKSTFDPYVGSIFQTPDARGRMINMTLQSVATNKPTTRTITTATPRQTDSFSLMFKATKALPEFTSIFRVSHPALGTFDLFLTPHSQGNGQPLYEAVFNHI